MKLPGLKGEWEPPDRVEYNAAGVPTYFWNMELPPASLSSMVAEFGEWSVTAEPENERTEAFLDGETTAAEEARLAAEHARLRWERVSRRWGAK